MNTRSAMAALLASILVVTVSPVAAQSTTLFSQVDANLPSGIPAGGPFVPPGGLWDNEQSNGSTSLASQDSTGTLTARSADDFNIPIGACESGQFNITQIRTQMVQADAVPQAFAVEIYNDDGTGEAPTSGINPIASVAQSSQQQLGSFGVGTSIFEASFNTAGLIVDADTTYWISSFGIDAAGNSAAFNNFFAASNGASGTTANGVVIAPGAGVPDWTPTNLVIGPPQLAFAFALDGECVQGTVVELPEPAVVPTHSPLGLLLLGALLCLAGLIAVRRFS